MKTVKKILVSIVCIIAISGITNSVFALSGSEIKDKADSWINQGNQNTPPITTEEAWSKLLPVGQVLISIASIILVICYMFLGVKYMFADPSGKADVKQRLIWLVIATVVIYGGVGIFTLVVTLMNSILA